MNYDTKVTDVAPTKPARKGPDWMQDDYNSLKRQVMQDAEASDRRAREGSPATFSEPKATAAPAAAPLPDAPIGDIETSGGGPSVDIPDPAVALKPAVLEDMPDDVRGELTDGVQAYLRSIGLLAG